MDAKHEARLEREQLADFLQTLEPAQWDVMSLCDRWRVRDVVAHVVSYEELGFGGLARRLIDGRFSPDRMNAIGVSEYAGQAPEALVDLLRRHLAPSGVTAGFGGGIGLVDTLIHHQDIRRPLGAPREIPAARLRYALGFAVTAPAIRGFWNVRGVRLIATDLDWATGNGPEVRGKGEAALMALAGRAGVAHELSGPGQPTLLRRLE